MEQRGKTVVKSITGNKVMVDEGTGATKYIGTFGYVMQNSNIPVFLFYCNK